LLDAAGLKSYPALISSSRRIDPDVPSPAQFDHVIDFVPRGNTSIWLDTTPEVSPFAYLLTPLPGKQALVIADDKPPVLLTIPAEPLSPAIQSFQIAAKLSDDGTLEGNIENKVQGVIQRSVSDRHSGPLPCRNGTSSRKNSLTASALQVQ
jgi:hypothetical protein